MSESLPNATDFSAAPKFVPPRAASSLDLTVHLKTPLFGGGVRAGYLDPATPFRTSAIRGQLRFWWRATMGAQYETHRELHERESAIFGDTSRQSAVRIQVTVPRGREGKRLPLTTYERDPAIRYALFPPYEAKQKDLTSPRRGLGSLYCRDYAGKVVAK